MSKSNSVNHNAKTNFRLGQIWYYRLRSIAEIFMALICTVALLPVFLMISILIKIDSHGPVLFVQRRIGINGKEFKIIKFRSMLESAPHDLPTKDFKDRDKHLSKFGRKMRRIGLDELPQLINILLGQMSFIGPRPSLFNETEQISLRKFYSLNSIRPGLTGWAQVNANGLVPAKRKIAFDLYYFENFGLPLDVKIAYLTIKLIARKGRR